MQTRIEEVDRNDIWKFREVFKIIKMNNGKVTKKESTNLYIKKNNIKRLDFKQFTIEPVYIHNLISQDENSDYINLSMFIV
jgi:hypothetical protein